MKKLVCITLTLLLLMSAASAATSFSTMTTAELMDLLSGARNEIMTRAAKVSGQTFIIDDNNVQIYFTGKGREGWSGFDMEVAVVNNTKDTIYFSCDCVTVNGWQITGYDDIPIVYPGNRAIGTICINYKSVGLESISEIEEVVISSPYVFNDALNHIANGKDVVIDFQGCDWK